MLSGLVPGKMPNISLCIIGLESASGTRVISSATRTDRKSGEREKEREARSSRGKPAIDTMTSTLLATNEAVALASWL